MHLFEDGNVQRLIMNEGMDGGINNAISLSQTEQGQGRKCRGANGMLGPSASPRMSCTLLF